MGENVHSGGRRKGTAAEGSVDKPALMAKSQPNRAPRAGLLANMSLGYIPGRSLCTLCSQNRKGAQIGLSSLV
jgi:hypothetical protein